jgi:hypothetical protein
MRGKSRKRKDEIMRGKRYEIKKEKVKKSLIELQQFIYLFISLISCDVLFEDPEQYMKR